MKPPDELTTEELLRLPPYQLERVLKARRKKHSPKDETKLVTEQTYKLLELKCLGLEYEVEKLRRKLYAE